MKELIKQRSADVRLAMAELQALDIPDALSVVAFKYLLRGTGDQGGTGSGPASTGGPSSEGDRDSPLNALARKAGVPLEVARDVFAQGDHDEPELVVSVRRLGDTDAEATRQIALLICGARQAMNIEEWTPTSEIRKWARNYSKMDSTNFASTIVSMDEDFTMRGSGASRELRMTMPGWESWASLIGELAGT